MKIELLVDYFVTHRPSDRKKLYGSMMSKQNGNFKMIYLK